MIVHAVYDWSWGASDLITIFTNEDLADAYASTNKDFTVEELEVDVEAFVEAAQKILEKKAAKND